MHLEKQGKGYIIASLGELLNEEVPYTCFSSLKSYFNNNEEKLIKFTKAIKKGLDFVNVKQSSELVNYLSPSFTSSSNEEIISVIDNYKSIDAWPSKLGFTNDNFNKLIDIVKEAGELDKDVIVPYDKLVTNEILSQI